MKATLHRSIGTEHSGTRAVYGFGIGSNGVAGNNNRLRYAGANNANDAEAGVRMPRPGHIVSIVGEAVVNTTDAGNNAQFHAAIDNSELTAIPAEIDLTTATTVNAQRDVERNAHRFAAGAMLQCKLDVGLTADVHHPKAAIEVEWD